MLIHPVYHIQGYPYPKLLVALIPIHERSSVVYVIMLHPKLFTRHPYHLSLDHLSYCCSCHLVNVCMHWYTLVHAFCRYTLGQAIESFQMVAIKHLNQCIWSRAFICHHWNKFALFCLPSPLRWLQFIAVSHPLHNLEVSLQGMKFTGGGGWWDSFRLTNILALATFLQSILYLIDAREPF